MKFLSTLHRSKAQHDAEKKYAPADLIRLTYSLYWRKTQMNATKLIGIILIAGGGLGLAYGGFSYTKETTGVKLGPLELKVQEKERINVPLVVSAGAIVLGVFLLVVGRK